VGKTATASRRAATVVTLDRAAEREIVIASPASVLAATRPLFIDEWQRVPDVWNEIRHAVDDGAEPGSFLLAGSSSPIDDAELHSGAGRFVRVHMRPMNLVERGVAEPTVSLASLLGDETAQVGGTTPLTLTDYAEEIMRSGFPGIRSVGRLDLISDLLRDYANQIVQHDIPDSGEKIRRPKSLFEWLSAYAAATGTTASYASLLTSATPGQDEKPSKVTTMSYRDVLTRMWVLDPLEAWAPSTSHLKRLGQAPKHHLVDPALAASLVGVGFETLLKGGGPTVDGTFLGSLFESLAVQHVRVLAQGNSCGVFHMRELGGRHEVDMIIRRPDSKVVACEVKLSSTVRPKDVSNLNWLEAQAPELVLDKILINTGPYAYRRKDGVAVVPLGLLGM
jgi:predicted AAA+ superfamily ATPase